jgi:hypothetical protein
MRFATQTINSGPYRILVTDEFQRNAVAVWIYSMSGTGENAGMISHIWHYKDGDWVVEPLEARSHSTIEDHEPSLFIPNPLLDALRLAFGAPMETTDQVLKAWLEDTREQRDRAQYQVSELLEHIIKPPEISIKREPGEPDLGPN